MLPASFQPIKSFDGLTSKQNINRHCLQQTPSEPRPGLSAKFNQSLILSSKNTIWIISRVFSTITYLVVVSEPKVNYLIDSELEVRFYVFLMGKVKL